MSDDLQFKYVPSPCVGLCELDDQDLCVACRRSGMEIADWGGYSNEEKRAVWALIKRREAGETDI